MVPPARWSKYVFPERVENSVTEVSKITDGCWIGELWAWCCMAGFLETQSVELFYLILNVLAVTGEDKDFGFNLDFHFSWRWIRPVDLRKYLGCRCLHFIQLLLIKWGCFLTLLGLELPVLPHATPEERTGRLLFLKPKTYLSTGHFPHWVSCWWYDRLCFKVLLKPTNPSTFYMRNEQQLNAVYCASEWCIICRGCCCHCHYLLQIPVWDRAGNLLPHTFPQDPDKELELLLPPLWT